MTNKLNVSKLVAMIIVFTLFVPMTVMAAPTLKARVTEQKVTLDGTIFKLPMYNIDNSNYVKLRDFAVMLNDTDNQFSVAWDAEKWSVIITTGEQYKTEGSELTVLDTDNLKIVAATNKILVDGVETGISAYIINDTNYLKLRELSDVVGVGCEYNAETMTAELTTAPVVESEPVVDEEAVNDDTDEEAAYREYINSLPYNVVYSTITSDDLNTNVLTDHMNYKFVDDPELIGEWKAVYFVRNIADFDPNIFVLYPDLVFRGALDVLSFYAGGTYETNKDNGHYRIANWTKGLIVRPLYYMTICAYEIHQIDGVTYMFMQWKSGDYVSEHMTPQYYVFQKQ